MNSATDNAKSHTNQGNTFQASGQLLEAVKSYLQALEFKHDFFDAHNGLGVALCKLGHFNHAVEAFQHAVKFSPNSADVHNNIGNVMLFLSRVDEAVSSYHRALEIKPDYAEAHNNLGVALHRLGRYAEAATSCRCALNFSPNYAEAYFNLGNALQFCEQVDDAIASYHRALEIKPDYAEAHNNLGAILCTREQLDAAAACYRRALEIKPDYVEAHNNLGVTLCNLGQLEAAAASYRRALEISPGLVDPHSNLGIALMYLGKLEEGESFLSKAIDMAPDDASVLIAALFFIPYQPDDPRFKRLETFYEQRESLQLEDRIKLNFVFGKSMAEIGLYDRAFIAFEEGNHLHYREHPFDEVHENSLIDKLCSFYSADRLKKFAVLAKNLPPIQDDRTPVFIVGMPRSGTTLMEQILASHPNIFGAGELPTLGILAQKADLILSTASSDELALLELRKLGQEYLDQVWKLAPESRYITDKMPDNFHHLGLIHLMFPNVRIIHSLREMMDTCFSCYSHYFKNANESTYNLKVLGRQYLRHLKLMQHWENVLPPDQLIKVHYEDVVTDIEREIKRVLVHLGLSWNKACLRFYETERTVRTASVIQVRKPIYTSSIGRWKLFEKNLDSLLKIKKTAEG